MAYSSSPDANQLAQAPALDRKVYNLEQIYVRIGDRYDSILASLDLPALDPSASLGAEITFRLALVTAFQYAELLPDTTAEAAALARKDWKYALHLSLKHPGISASALVKFRESLYFSTSALQVFRQLLDCLGALGLFSGAEKRSLDPIQALNMVCLITRFDRLSQAMKSVLSFLVAAHPDWLRANAKPHWYTRYKTGSLSEPAQALSREAMQEKAVRYGKDFQYLISAMQDRPDLLEQPEIRHIAQILDNEFRFTGSQPAWEPACAPWDQRDTGPAAKHSHAKGGTVHEVIPK